MARRTHKEFVRELQESVFWFPEDEEDKDPEEFPDDFQSLTDDGEDG